MILEINSTPKDESVILQEGRKTTFKRKDLFLKELTDQLATLNSQMEQVQSQLKVLQDYDLITRMEQLIKSSDKAFYYLALAVMIEQSNIEGEDLPSDFDDIVKFIRIGGEMPSSFVKWVQLIKAESTNKGGK